MAGLAAAIAGAIGGLADIGFGIADRVKSNKTKNMSLDAWKRQMGFEDPTTPESYTKELEMRRVAQRQGLPGEAAMKADVNQSTAAALSGAQNLDSGSAAAVLLGANQQRMNSLRQIGIMASQYQRQNQENYMRTLGQGAQYDIRNQDFNNTMAQIKGNEWLALRGAGQSSIVSGIDTIGAAGVNYANMQAQENWFNSMMPQNSGPVGNTNPASYSQMSQNYAPYHTQYSPPSGTYDQLPF